MRAGEEYGRSRGEGRPSEALGGGVPSREQLERTFLGRTRGDCLGGNIKTSTPQAACWWGP